MTKLDAINITTGILIGVAFTRFIATAGEGLTFWESIIWCGISVVGVLFLMWYNQQ